VTNIPLKVSWFARPTARPIAEVFSLTWDELRALLEESWHTGPKNTAPGWSPCALEPCPPVCRSHGLEHKYDCGGWQLHRLNKNVAAVYLLGLDIDKRTSPELQRVLEAVEPYEYLIHSTASHTSSKQKNCFRIILPLAQTVSEAPWPATREHFLRNAGIFDIVDDTKDACRFFYVPTKGLEENVFEHHPGALLKLELIDFAAHAPRPKPSTPATPVPAESPPSLDEVREALLQWKSPDPDKKERARLLARGKPFADAGKRDVSFTGLVGQVLGAWPWVEDTTLEALFLPSLGEMVSRDGDSNVERELEKLWDKAGRFREPAQEHRLEEMREEAARKKGLDKLAQRLRQGAPRPPAVLQADGLDIPPPPGVEEDPEDPWQRPIIQVSAVIEEMVELAEEALAADPRAFCASNALVRLCRTSGKALPFMDDVGNDAPHMAPLGEATLRAWLSTDAQWLSAEEGEARTVMPPGCVVSALKEHSLWPHVRRLTGFAETPVFRRDGSLISRPGYDEATGLYYVAPKGLYVPSNAPTLYDAQEASEDLLEVVEDFPFEDDVARSAWLCGLLTPFVRQDLQGLCPMFVVDANIQGSGKTKLVDLISLVCSGRVLAKMANTTDDDEMRKRLLAVALEGTNCVLLDNVRGALGTPSLESALTAGVVKERVLGENRTAQAPLRACWFAGGNNIEYEGDLVRRVLQVRLVSPLERPYERSGFRHADIERWVLDERPRLVAACLRVWRSYFAAGTPKHKSVPWGSFERWQDLVFGAVEWLGLASPDGARLRASAAPAEREQMIAVMKALKDIAKDGWCGAAAFSAKAGGPGAANAAARGALQELCGDHGGNISVKRVSKLFGRYKETVLGGMRLRRQDGEEGALWRVETIKGAEHLKE
jgi:hypothetical protein